MKETNSIDDLMVMSKLSGVVYDFFRYSTIASYRKEGFINKVTNSFFDLAVEGHKAKTRGRSIYAKILEAKEEDIVMRYRTIDFKLCLAITVKSYIDGDYHPMSMLIPLSLVCVVVWNVSTDMLDQCIFNSDLNDISNFKSMQQLMKHEAIK